MTWPGSAGRGPAPVPPEIALDHPYAGLVVAWIRGDSTDSVLAAAAGLRAGRDLELLTEDSPIGQIIDFVQVAKEGGLPPLTGEHPEVLRLYFCQPRPRALLGRLRHPRRRRRRPRRPPRTSRPLHPHHPRHHPIPRRTLVAGLSGLRDHDGGPEGHHVFYEEGGEVGGSGDVGAANGEAGFGGVEEAVEIY